MHKVNKVTPAGKHILKDVTLGFYHGAKIGILGANGAGKSTVMRIIAGLDESFTGDVTWSPGISVGYLSQEPQLDESKTVREIVEEGTAEIVNVLKEYEEINAKFMDEEILNSPEKNGSLDQSPSRGSRPHRCIECLGIGYEAQHSHGRITLSTR